MKAPIDKVKPGANPRNDIIQIIVTTSCDLLHCSNCTQLLPYRTDTRFMSPDVFRACLRSLAGWPGVRAMFGGNPCVHPKFAELCRIMQEEVPDKRQRGLWTNHLRGHGRIIRETFFPGGRFNLNVHAHDEATAEMEEWLPGVPIYGVSKESWHSPVLMHWADVGLTYEEWAVKREGCDVNQRWSSAMAERDGQPYAYFCEIGAALDGIRGENHGVLAEPGWWQWPMGKFAHQVGAHCDRGCGIPLKYRGHLDGAEVYDASAAFVPLLQIQVRRRPTVQVHDGPMEAVPIATDYQRIHQKP